MLKYGNTIIDHSEFGPRNIKKRIVGMILIAIGVALLIWTAGCILIATAIHFGEINPGEGVFLGGLIFNSLKEISAAITVAIIMAMTGIIVAIRNE